MLNTQLLLVRHGETVWNAEGRLQGSNDIELNAAGLAQAEHVAAAIAASPRRVEAIYCSPLIRARKTGEIIGQHLQLAVTSDGRFAERGLGQLEGKTKDDVLASDPELWAAWASGGELPANRGIETEDAVVSRVADGLASIKGTDLLVRNTGDPSRRRVFAPIASAP
jgi:broad specificity phosphatase PhoE